MNKDSGKLIRFLHCSDIHLDTPYVSLSSEKSEECRRELRSTFMRMMDHIKERSIDYVLISGDLFDKDYIERHNIIISFLQIDQFNDSR